MAKVIIDELLQLKWPAIQQDHRAQLVEIDQVSEYIRKDAV